LMPSIMRAMTNPKLLLRGVRYRQLLFLFVHDVVGPSEITDDVSVPTLLTIIIERKSDTLVLSAFLLELVMHSPEDHDIIQDIVVVRREFAEYQSICRVSSA
jgi:hypothetical protein